MLKSSHFFIFDVFFVQDIFLLRRLNLAILLNIDEILKLKIGHNLNIVLIFLPFLGFFSLSRPIFLAVWKLFLLFLKLIVENEGTVLF